MSFADDKLSSVPRNNRGITPFAGRQQQSAELDSFGNSSSTQPMSSSIANEITLLASNITQIESMAKQIGSSKDNAGLRERMNSLLDATRTLSKEVTESVRNFDSKDRGPEKRILQQKLTKDLQHWIQKFQEVYKFATDKDRSTPVPINRPKTNSSFPVNANYEYNNPQVDYEKESLMESSRREQFQLQNAVDYHDTIIREREMGIKEIQKSVVEVNEIFRDLGSLVAEQGHMIDSIESNIEMAVDTTTKGTEEITKASNYQRKSRTKLCCLALIIVIILAVVVAIVVWVFVMKR